MARKLNRIFRSFAVACFACVVGTFAFASNELAQSFTLDGQLMLAGTTTVLSDSAAVLKIDILDPTKSCVLYEEQQTVNTVSSDGYFSVQVGSVTGASKRTSSDPGLTMAQVFQNTSAVAATSASGSTCTGNTYTPTADAVRYFRITVTPSSTNVADVLSPDTTIDAAPMAMVAQSLQGYAATDFLAKAGLPTCSSGTFLSYDGTTLSCAGVSGSNGGTVTSITAGTGLTGGTITASGTLALATSGATAGTYGSASAVPVVTVDTYGRVTNVTTASISSAPTGTASGDLSGTYPSPTVNGLSGTALSISSLTSGQYLKYNGTNWVNSTLSVSDSNITYGSEAANTFFAAPNGSAGTPTFRAMVAADLPTVPYTRGGTGLTATPANGQIAIGNGAGYTLGTLTAGTGVSITNTAGAVTIAATGGTGTVTSVTGTSPISVATGTSTPVVSISQATTSTSGYLSSTDWNTFNSKMSSSLASGDIFVGNSSGGAVAVPVSGDATLSSTGALTLATVATAGTYPKVVVNAKGLVTSGSALSLTDLPSIASGTVLANVSGSAGAPTATTVSAVLDSIGAVQGDILYRGSSGWSVLAPGTSGQYLQTQGASANPQWATVTGGGSGTVTSVGLSLPAMFTVTNSPVTTSGTLTATLASETANTFFAAPNGSAGSPTFRAIASADLPTIPVSGGGTGLTAGTSGGVPYYATTGTMASSAALTQYGVVYGGGAGAAPATTAVGTSGYVLTSNGGSSAPTFQQLSLSSGVTGTLPITQGGTGATTAAAARTALGTAASGANADITSTADLTSIASTTSAITIAPTGNLNLSPSTAVVSSAVYESPLGTAAAPAYTNSTSPNTGMYFPSSTSLGFSAAGANAMTVLSSGNVGVATTNPLTPLHVNGTSTAGPNAVVRITQTGGSITNGPYALVIGDDSQDSTNYRGFRIALDSGGNAGFEDFMSGSFRNIYFAPDGGNVGVGTATPSYKLDVAGQIRSSTGGFVFPDGTTQTSAGGSCSPYTTGSSVCVGNGLQSSSATGGQNSAVGIGVMAGAVTGTQNSAMGRNSMTALTTGSNNAAFGSYALDFLTTGNQNAALGDNAGLYANGNYNVFVGQGAGNNSSFTSGSDNVFVGQGAGSNQTAGNSNILIGQGTQAASVTGSNQLNIGNWIYGTSGSIGIGTTAPAYKLDVAGDVNVSGSFRINGTAISNTSGTVTSVGMSLPSMFTVTNSPVTTSGTLTATLASQTANTFFAAPNGSAGSPTFRTIASADLPAISLSTGVTGTLPIASGGTGSTTAAAALTALGAAANGANADITSTADLTNVSSTTSAITIAPTGNLNLSPSTAVVSSAVFESPLGTAAAPAYTNSTAPATGMYFPTSTSLGFSTAGANAMTILSNGDVGIGTDAPSYIVDINGGILHTTGAAAFENDTTTVSGSTFSFWKTRNYGADLSGDELGFISFYGDDGTGLHRSSYILSTVTAAPVSGTHTVQGDLEFYTTSSGASDSTEKMVITSAGNVGIGSTSPVTKLSIVPTVYTTQTDGIEFISSDNSVNAIVQPIKIANANMNLFLGANMYANTAGGTPLFSTAAAGAGIDIRSDSGSIQFYSGTTGNAPTANMVMNSSGYLGIGTGSPSYTLHVVGTAGLSTGTAWTNASDIRLKDIQGDYTHGLDEVLKLHTVKYNYKKGNALGLPSDFTKTGFIAQEVQKVIPEAVSTRKDGYLELNVDPIHWAVVNAVKDLYNKYIVKMLETEKKQDRDIASLKAAAEQEKARQDLEIEKLKKENAEKTKELSDLKARMDRLEKALAK